MSDLPSSLALTNIPDGGPEVASPLRNNYTAIQTAVNTLVAALAGGSAGQLLQSLGASAVGWLPDAPADGDALVWNAAAGRWKPGTVGGAGTEFDYAQITADVTGINTTTESTSTAVITGNAVTYANSRVKVEFFAPNAAGVSGAVTITFVFYRDTTVIGQFNAASGTDNWTGPLNASCFDTPAAGSHTYALKAYLAAASPTLTVHAGAGGSGTLVPAFLRVTKA